MAASAGYRGAVIKFIVGKKFLFDMGTQITSQLMGIFNTSLMIYVASDKIRASLHVAVPSWVMIVVAGAVYVIGTFIIGTVMDRSGALTAIQDEYNKRNEALLDIHKSTGGGRDSAPDEVR